MSNKSDLEMNKIFAAVLVAGISAMLAGFIAEQIVHPEELKEDAVFVEGMSGASGGAMAKAGPEPILALIAAADIAKGEKLSKACAACHSFEQGGPGKIGPNLWGVVGASKGAKSGFAYSDALKSAGGSWDYISLNKFLWKPKSLIDGTNMNFIGLKKPEDRAAMIAWLRTLGSSAGLPSAAQIAAEEAELAPPPAAEPAAGNAPSVPAGE